MSVSGVVQLVVQLVRVVESGHKEQKMVNNPQHVLHSMVPEIKSNNRYELRNNNKSYKVDLIINSKLRNSFIHRNFCHDKQ